MPVSPPARVVVAVLYRWCGGAVRQYAEIFLLFVLYVFNMFLTVIYDQLCLFAAVMPKFNSSLAPAPLDPPRPDLNAEATSSPHPTPSWCSE
jgi:hypothetical protein